MMATPQANLTFPNKYMIEFASIVAHLKEFAPHAAPFVESRLDQIFLQADRSFDIRKFHHVIEKVILNTKW